MEKVAMPAATIRKPHPAVIAIPRSVFWTGLVVGILAVTGGVAIKKGWYHPIWDAYQAAQVTLKVREDGKFAVANADVLINGKTYHTDAAGQITLGLKKGDYPFKVSKVGFSQKDDTLSLRRGSNNEHVLAIARLPEKQYSIIGYVHDAISDKPVVNTAVTVGTATLYTNPDGEYRFTNLQPGSYDLKITHADYQGYADSVVLTDQDNIKNPISLVPVGRALFVSNRSGRRGLYTIAFDGSDSRPLGNSVGGGEDFAPVLSPDGRLVAFSSTRDGLRDPYGAALAKLYVIGLDGSNLRKVSDGVAPEHIPLWSPDSKWLYDKSAQTSAATTFAYTVYDITRSTSQDVGEAVVNPLLSPDGSRLAYTVFGSDLQPGLTPDQPATRENYYAIKTFNLVTGEHVTLAKHQQYSESLSFSADSATLFYELTQDGQRHRYGTVAATSLETEVPLQSVDSKRYVSSPDGKQKVFIDSRDGKKDIFKVAADGKDEQRLTTMGTINDQIAPRWDSSGRYITFAVAREGESAIYIISREGTTPKKLTDFNPT